MRRRIGYLAEVIDLVSVVDKVVVEDKGLAVRVVATDVKVVVATVVGV